MPLTIDAARIPPAIPAPTFGGLAVGDVFIDAAGTPCIKLVDGQAVGLVAFGVAPLANDYVVRPVGAVLTLVPA